MSTIGRTAGFLLVVLVLGVAVTAARQRPAPAPPTERTTVVAELFTSGRDPFSSADLSARQSADVVVAVTEDGLATTVARGENGGRTLRHAAVTRSLITIGVLEAGVATVDLQAAVPLAAEWATSNLRLVAFVQESSSRRIHGGGAIRLDAPATRAGEGR